MADKSAIEWTDATWNPVAGCSIVSPGCTNCYAMKMAARIEAMGSAPHYAGLTTGTKAGAVWTGRIAVAPDSILTQPLRWKRPRRIFVNSMSDLFHENLPDEAIDKVFAVMALCPQHTFQVLTKRAARMRDYIVGRVQRLVGNVGGAAEEIMLEQTGTLLGDVKTTYPSKVAGVREQVILRLHGGLPNVWLGVSTEDQARADERIPELLATPAAKRFISAEPLLGGLNLDALRDSGWHRIDALRGLSIQDQTESTLASMKTIARLDWVIAGGESGPKARPSHPDWFRSLRDQCDVAEVPFFFKQWGEWSPLTGTGYVSENPDHKPDQLVRVGKKRAGALLDGREHREFPT